MALFPARAPSPGGPAADGVRLRAAAAADEACVAAVYQRSWAAAFAAHLPEGALRDVDLGAAGARSVAAPWCLLATDEDDRVLGFAAADPGSGLLERLYVDPSAWGTGVAERLLVAARDALLAEAGEAHLWVWQENTRAVRCYTRAGWMPAAALRVGQVAGVEFTYRLMRYLSAA